MGTVSAATASQRKHKQAVIKAQVATTSPNADGQDGPLAWERLSIGETALNFERFQYFLSIGPKRLYPAVANHFHLSLNRVKIIAGANNWMARAAAYDAYIARQQAAEQQEVAARVGTAPPNWHDRGRRVRAAMYKAGMNMLEKVQARLDLADGLEMQSDGTYKQVTPRPLDIADKDWPTYARMAQTLLAGAVQGDLTRPSTGAASSEGDETDEAGIPKVPTDISSMSEAQLQKYFADIKKFQSRINEASRSAGAAN